MVIRERNYTLHTACYAPSEAQDIPNDMLISADKIPIALLRTCRSVYAEVLPIIHTQNTFYFLLGDFPPAIRSGLGLYCLQDLRNVYLYSHHLTTVLMNHPLRILQRMCLDTLTLEFAGQAHPRTFSVDVAWCRDLLTIRHLRNLEIFFRRGNAPHYPFHRETVTQTLRDLMIGPGADAKYEAFLLEKSQRE
ncbi:hypothetical protein B0H13DRAFT_2049943 [Mycena leptocephala]|nr:hypothetical protein B0H13DRAFT_2049943 [Mycena leptocephala]